MNFGEPITLTGPECERAIIIGGRRQLWCQTRGSKMRYNDPRGNDGWRNHIEGAAGELAACRFFGVTWPESVNTFKMPDVVIGGRKVQVRTRLSGPKLIVRQIDNDSEVFVLVHGEIPTFTIHGWLTGAEAKALDLCRRIEADMVTPVWFIPVDKLCKEPMEMAYEW